MASPLTRTVRCTTALVLMMCFGLFTAEILIADVHDGDVRANHPVSIERTPSHANAGGLPHAPTEAAHSMHVCHCIHAHSGLATAAAVSSMSPEGATAPVVGGDRVPVSLEREPQLRPPIA